MSSFTANFEDWYEANKSYYSIKHGGDEEAMRKDALNAHGTIKMVSVAPPKMEKKKRKKEKPNPYGFDK